MLELEWIFTIEQPDRSSPSFAWSRDLSDIGTSPPDYFSASQTGSHLDLAIIASGVLLCAQVDSPVPASVYLVMGKGQLLCSFACFSMLTGSRDG